MLTFGRLREYDGVAQLVGDGLLGPMYAFYLVTPVGRSAVKAPSRLGVHLEAINVMSGSFFNMAD